MDLPEIERSLQHDDFQYRLKAVSALKDYPVEIAVPLLLKQVQDPEFLVRSFVAMALGHHQTADSFAALLQMMKFDNTPNVRAEAANSLSLFGRACASHLVLVFERDTHWLVRQSILAALTDLGCVAELLEVCEQAIQGRDRPVREASIRALTTLADRPDGQAAALGLLLPLVQDSAWRTRQQVAIALKCFALPKAQAALAVLKTDDDERVVASTWSDL